MTTSQAAITLLGSNIGAQVSGVDLSRELSGAEKAFVHQALIDHHVLFFRDQSLEPVDIKRFAEGFGPLAPHPRGGPDYPEVMPFRSKQEPDFILGTEWHTDGSYSEHPPLGSMLYFREAPEAGAELAYANMHAAFEALSPQMTVYLKALTATHDVSRSRFGSDRQVKTSWSHPLISSHAVTGRPLLYFNSVYTARIDGVPTPESRAIIGFLREHVANPYFSVRIKVEPGSLVLWDNRCTQHLALWNFAPGSLAGLRTQIESVTP
ncbi:TauD/TfdA family dioxygenase [Sphingomonas sp.]|uniref:TauD/TfdA dioxygenase family protein n=1 Tax=Sphingomonas sp. TaxID=28214 RepID=UPI0025FCE768|nr:TauD/TfdA family dioxygenase [Sphingomonas sp.]